MISSRGQIWWTTLSSCTDRRRRQAHQRSREVKRTGDFLGSDDRFQAIKRSGDSTISISAGKGATRHSGYSRSGGGSQVEERSRQGEELGPLAIRLSSEIQDEALPDARSPSTKSMHFITLDNSNSPSAPTQKPPTSSSNSSSSPPRSTSTCRHTGVNSPRISCRETGKPH